MEGSARQHQTMQYNKKSRDVNFRVGDGTHAHGSQRQSTKVGRPLHDPCRVTSTIPA